MPKLVKPEQPERPAKPIVPPENTGEKPGKVTTKEAAESAKQVAAEIAQAAPPNRRPIGSRPLSCCAVPPEPVPTGTEEMQGELPAAQRDPGFLPHRCPYYNVPVPRVTRYEVELDKGVG